MNVLLVVGFDHDPIAIFNRQLDFIQRAGVITAMVGLLTALPHTRLYHRLLTEGRRPKQFPHAVELLIMGYHFRPVANLL